MPGINDSVSTPTAPSGLKAGESNPGTLPQSGLGVPAGWESPTIKQLSQMHPDYKDLRDDWTKMSILYEGGHTIRQVSTQFLQRRPRELQEVYQARVDRFTYDNILGACFGWYRAALFKNPPTIIGSTAKDQKGALLNRIVNSIAQFAARATGIPLTNRLDEFYISFRDDCDRTGTSLVDFYRGIWTNFALHRVAYVLIDLPQMEIPATSLKDQIDAGVLDDKGKPLPYLVSYSPLSVINWNNDRYGNLEWAIVQMQGTRREFLEDEHAIDTWYYFDKQKFLKYEYKRAVGETALTRLDENARATLVANGAHSLSQYMINPLLRFEVSEDLWLANRAFLPVIDYLNHENAYKWALELANLCMPVINSDDDIDPQLSEAGFIKLPKDAKYGWTEPEGRTFGRSAERLVQLREDIYRLLYLVYQGRRSTASADGASAQSKEQDLQPAQDVLNEYGEMICRAMQKTMNLVARAREDSTVFDVRGMKFGKTITLEAIQKVAAILALGVPSDAFYREVFRQTASEALPDVNPDVIDTIYEDIEKAEGMSAMYALANGQAGNDLGATGEGKKIADMFNKPYRVPLPRKPKNIGAPRTQEDIAA